MKNLFKFGFLALALSLTVVACSSENKGDATDSNAVDSTMMDTTMTTDTGMVDTTMTTDTTAAPMAH